MLDLAAVQLSTAQLSDRIRLNRSASWRHGRSPSVDGGASGARLGLPAAAPEPQETSETPEAPTALAVPAAAQGAAAETSDRKGKGRLGSAGTDTSWVAPASIIFLTLGLVVIGLSQWVIHILGSSWPPPPLLHRERSECEASDGATAGGVTREAGGLLRTGARPTLS